MKWKSSLFRASLFVPLLWIAYKILFNKLGAEPAIELNHNCGMTALYLLLGNLLIGILLAFVKPFPLPLRFFLSERRFLGLTSFFYICAHMFFYFASEAFDFKKIPIEILSKTYLQLGFAAFLILLSLALTSNDFSVRKLGGKKWKKLHRWIYLAIILISIHMLLIEKADLIYFASLLVPYHSVQIFRFFKTRMSIVGHR